MNWHVGWRWVGGSVQGEVMMERSRVGVIQYAWGRRCISRCLSGVSYTATTQSPDLHQCPGLRTLVTLHLPLHRHHPPPRRPLSATQ